MKKHAIKLLMLLGLILAGVENLASADELNWSAKQIYDSSVADQVIFNTEGNLLELAKGVQYEDDGPAAGFSYQPNAETVAGDVWIKKQLVVDRPEATAATLIVARSTNIHLKVNGQDASVSPIGKIGNYWQAYRINPDSLKKGLNEFVLSASPDVPSGGRNRMTVWIARDDEYSKGAVEDRKPPGRSFKSTDAGKSWTEKLGNENDIQGEYLVRLLLEQYMPEGTVTLPVIDAGNLQQQDIGPPVSNVGPIEVSLKTKGEDTEGVSLQLRSGSTYAVQQDTWSEWETFSDNAAKLAKPKGRFVQIRINLESDSALQSPSVQSLTISANPQRPTDWTQDWKITKSDNPAVVRSPVPFKYEPFDEPLLEKYREQENLDELTKDAKTQFEAACEIAKWSAHRLKDLGHLKDTYPGWNALEILSKHEDGRPIGGFCQQYSLLFLQACLSQGLTVRAVSVGPGNHLDKLRSGHETVELWSDDYRKWVYLDGNTGWYIKDVETGVPLSIWEIRQRQLAAIYGKDYPPVEFVKLTETRYNWQDLSGGMGFVMMRLLPRNNFLSQKYPLPLNQGMRGWFWPEHWVSADPPESIGTLYHHRLFRQADAEWTLNHAHITLEATSTPGEVKIHLDSQTPGWETYLTRWNDGSEEESGSVLVKKLGPGPNRLEVVPRNIRGQLGSKTFVELSK